MKKRLDSKKKTLRDISFSLLFLLYVGLSYKYLFGNDINEGRIKKQNVF
jgi:hypothetical protein